MSNGQRVAYVRVSTLAQNIARQEVNLGPLDHEPFIDKVSGKNADRPKLAEMLAYVRSGDTVVIASMDRFARNLADLRRLVDELTGRGVRVEFVKEGLTFTGEDSAMSKLLLNVMGSFAEFERELILERQREGIAIAKAAKKYKGRKPSLTPEQVEQARQRVASGVPVAAVAREFGVSRSTLYNVGAASKKETAT